MPPFGKLPPEPQKENLLMEIARMLQMIEKQKQRSRSDQIIQMLSGAQQGEFPGMLQQFQQQQQPQGLQGLLQSLNPAAPSSRMSDIERMIAGQQVQQLSPYRQAQTESAEARGAYYREAAKPKPPTPSQQISQKKLDKINRLQAKVKAGTATKADQAMLDKMLGGVSPVQITFGKPASAAERTAIAETRASIDALNNLKALFDSNQTKVGPVAGRVAPTMGLFSLTTDEQEAFMAATSAFKNKIIKEITGAQMSEVEAQRIMKQVPDITDPPTRWQAKWEQSKKNLEFLQKRRMEILRQSGLRAPTGAIETGFQAETPSEVTIMSTEELKRIAGVE